MTASAGLLFESTVARLRAAGCVFAEDEARLLLDEFPDPANLESAVSARTTGQPLETILGWVEFCGLRLAVGPGVFVPRKRTELLVRKALALLSPASVAVELCCGVAAVSAAILASARVTLYAADIDPAAVALARANLEPAGRVFEGDLFAALPAELRGEVSVLVANAPYVPTGSIALLPPEARDFEPLVSLDGGADGLDIHRRIAAEAPAWLAPGGRLIVESSLEQADQTAAIFAVHGFATRVVHDDEIEGTAVIGSLPKYR
jgi:release factor glutamine methyltransferase